ncbi:hypothetical protein EV363DRAFT_1450544 [Boletus edulis]|nr:hypothetical protein EV363DRAFT_1450544 [Boletus edulis]
MLNNINAMDRSTPLANSAALIQSAGTGKSRMVDEMTKLVFTIPFNVRLPDERSPRAYPPEDYVVWEYLCKSEVQKAEDGEVRVTSFFWNLFSEVATEVERVFLGRRIAFPAVIAEQADEANSWDTDVNFSKGCSLLGFPKALFVRYFHHSTPDNVASGYTLESAFERAVVRFTHFTKAADCSAMTMRKMVFSFLRGIDIAIPILLDKDRQISEPSMSGLLIRVQLRDQHGGVDEMGFFSQVSAAQQDMRPYVTLVAKLGLEVPGQSPDVNATESSMRSSALNVSGVEEDGEDHPRYSIRAYGCTDSRVFLMGATWNINAYDTFESSTTPASWPTIRDKTRRLLTSFTRCCHFGTRNIQPGSWGCVQTQRPLRARLEW